MENMRVQLPVELLEVYKIQAQDKLSQGYNYAEVPIELLIGLIERTQAWMQSEAHRRENEPTDVGRHLH